MAFRKATIVNCRRASIRKTPWIPWHDKELSGVRFGPNDSNDTIVMGDVVDVDTDQVTYDWTGRKFYKILHPKGWIYEGCIDLGEDNG